MKLSPNEKAWLEFVAIDPPTEREQEWRALVYSEALRLTREGRAVMPLLPGTKRPVLTSWQQLEPSVEAVVTWFGPFGEYRGYNLGVITGRQSDLWVLDVDLGHGPDAKRSLNDLVIARGADFLSTRVAETTSGGKHFWYRWPAEVPDPDTGEIPEWRNFVANRPAPGEPERTTPFGYGIDVKAAKGQIVVHPSRLGTPDEPMIYGLATGAVAAMPSWMSERSKHRPKVLRGVEAAASELPAEALPRADEYARYGVSQTLKRLDAMREAASGDWSRNDPGTYRGEFWDEGCFQVACRLLDFVVADWCDLDESAARSAFFERAPRDATWTDEDVQAKWAAARAAHKGLPARLPEWVLMPGGGGSMFGSVRYDPNTGEVLGADDPDGVDWSPSQTAQQPIVVDEEAQRKQVRDHLEVRDEKGRPLLMNGAERVLQDQQIALGRDGHYWRYEGGVWRRDPDVIAREGAKLFGNDWQHRYAATMDDHAKGLLPKLLMTVDPRLMNLRNGMLDWRVGELLPHDPSYQSQIQYPLLFDPDATCPNFDRWVQQVGPDGVSDRIWEVIAYMLLPGNGLQKAILLYGPGNNGKGTLIRVIQSLLGLWNCSAVTLRRMTTGRFDVAQLYGKAANIAGDIEASHLNDTAMFKALTGQDEVAAEQKHRDGFSFLNHATPLFSANELWRSRDNSEGYHRRWVIVPMTVRVSDLPPINEDDLLAELPGIFAKALSYLRGMMERKEEGLDPFAESVQTLIAKDQFAEASDLVRIWLAEDDAVLSHSLGSDDSSTALPRDQVHRRFKTWTEQAGLGTLGIRKFYDRLAALGYTSTRRNNKRVFLGFKLAVDQFGNIMFSD